MKLYYSPGACSLSPHIALEEAGLACEYVLASTKSHKLQDGSDFYGINPLGYVPMLELDDGTRLREGPAIVQYIADQAPGKQLAPVNGTLARYRLQEWLTFIGTELHKSFSPLFNPNPVLTDEVKAVFKAKLVERFTWVDSQLADREWVMGEQFTVADCYLFTVTNWAQSTKTDISALKNLAAWHAKVGQRPAVIAAMKAEGLIK